MKQTGFQMQHYDSSSTQSTGGESYSEVASLSEPTNRYGHNIVVTHLSGPPLFNLFRLSKSSHCCVNCI